MPPGVPPRKDPLRIAISVGVYAVTFWASQAVFLWVLGGLGALVGVTLSTLGAALFANWLVLRVYENRPLWVVGLYGSRAAVVNAGCGIAGGAGAACLVLGAPLALGMAHLVPAAAPATRGTIAFTIVLLGAGAFGEELLFHGYAFQILLEPLGRYATVFAVGAVFALMHSSNPNVSWFGLANTAGFGILFGYAFLRSRDLWLPIGFHFGWNFTLPLFGANLSGLRMNVTGHEIEWTAGSLWSGGAYGPEASVLTSGALVLLFVYLQFAPLSRQSAPLGGSAAKGLLCEPSSSPPA
jgi:membrane protease YdiL (CAAX protease family)